MSRFVIAPSVLGALEQMTELHPDRDRSYDGTIGDAAHAVRSSDHNPDSRGIVHAFDVTNDPAHGVDCNLLSALLRAKVLAGQEPRVKYVIWNRRIFNPAISTAWRPYTGPNPHDHHMHVSIKSGPEFENDDRPWWTPLAPIPTPAPPPSEEDDDMAKRYIGVDGKVHFSVAGDLSSRIQIAGTHDEVTMEDNGWEPWPFSVEQLRLVPDVTVR